MFLVLSLMLFTSYFMFIIYVDGDDYGYLDHFYFGLIIITIFDGFTNAFAFCIDGKYASLLADAIPISGALVSILHNIYKFFSDKYNLDDFDYHVLLIQLFNNIITMLVTCILWSIDGYQNRHPHDKGSTDDYNSNNELKTGSLGDLFSSDAADDHRADFPPICMLAFSLGTVYAFYPSIAPYSIIDYKYASVIELWILIISAIPTIVIAILDIAGVGPGSCDGASTSNKATNKGIGNWSNYTLWQSTTDARKWYKLYHCVWFCAIFYILCIQIFMSMLHYPHSFLSSFFNNKYAIGFISVLFNSVRELMQACGFAGAGKQVKQQLSAGNTLSKITCQKTGSHTPTCNKIRGKVKWSDDLTLSQVDGVIALTNNEMIDI